MGAAGKVAAVVAALAAATGVAVLVKRRREAAAAAASQAQAQGPKAERAQGAGAPATFVPPPAAGAPPAPVRDESAARMAGQVVQDIAKKALGGSAATVVAGIQVADGLRQVMTQVGGEGVGNTSAIFAPAAVGLAVKRGVEELGAKLGVPAEINHRIAQTAGVAVADPTGIVTSAKVTAEVVSLGIRAVAGAQAERTVRDAVKQFDPTNSKNVTHAPIAAAAKAVSAVSNIFKGGLFGKK